MFVGRLKNDTFRLYILFLTMLFLGVVVLGILYFRLQVDLLKGRMEQETTSEAQAFAEVLNRELETTVTTLKTLAFSEAILNHDALEARVLLERITAIFPFYQDIVVADKYGKTWTSVSSNAPPSLATRSYFQDAMSKGEPVVSQGLVSMVNGKPVIAVAVPYGMNGNRIPSGVIVTIFSTSDLLTPYLLSLLPPLNRDVYLVDKERKLILGPVVTQAGDFTTIDFSQIEDALAGKSGSGSSKLTPEGGEKLYSFLPVGKTGWALLVARSSEEFIMVARKATIIPVMIFSVFCLVTMFFFYFTVNALRRQSMVLQASNSYLISLANTDQVTGLGNHRRLHETLQETVAGKEPAALLLADIDNFRHYNDMSGHTAGDEVLRGVGEILSQVFESGQVFRYGQDQMAVVLPGMESADALALAKKAKDMVAAHPFQGRENQPGGKLTVSIGIACFPRDAEGRETLIKMAEQALDHAQTSGSGGVELYFSVFDELKDILKESEHDALTGVRTLIGVINSKDRYTYGHTERVVKYATALAKKVGLGYDMEKVVKYGAYLHDIGKIEIDRALLLKKGALTPEEVVAIREHPRIGADIVKPLEFLRETVHIILYHHERYDGMGYPEGLKGESIPLGARIVALADSFDAMTTNRPYKPALSFEEASKEIKKCAGTQFDPYLATLFLQEINSLRSVS